MINADGINPNESGDATVATAIQGYLDERNLPSVFIIGDSISIDYHSDLMALASSHYRYARKGSLTEALKNLDNPQGANGGNSSDVLEYLRVALGDGTIRADTILINCGLHDIKRQPDDGRIAVPINDYEENLRKIIQHVHGADKQLVWVSTTPVDEERHQSRQNNFHRYQADLQAYNSAAAQIMTANSVPVIDLHAFTLPFHDAYRDHVHFRSRVIVSQAAFIHEWLVKYFKLL